jgi:hypothetical protein
MTRKTLAKERPRMKRAILPLLARYVALGAALLVAAAAAGAFALVASPRSRGVAAPKPTTV